MLLKIINDKYPVQIETIEKVTNEMYRCLGAQGDWFARVTKYKTFDEQLEEVSWTNYLADHQIGVAPAVTSLDGNIVEKVLIPEEKYLVLFEAAQGTHVKRIDWNASILKKLGRQIGAMHRVTKEYEATHPIIHLNDWHENEEFQFLKYIPEEEQMIRGIADRVLSEVKALPKTRDTYGLLHGDVWLENVLVADHSKLTVIDFQDCEKHYYIFDLAVPLYSALEFTFAGSGNIKDYAQSIMEALIEGYLEENEIPFEMLEKLPLFLKLKEIFEYSLMHMYLNKERLTEEEVRILNLYRLRLEHNYSLDLNFDFLKKYQ